MAVAGAVLWGLALAAGALWLTTLGSGGPDERLLTESERQRRRGLRQRSAVYRWFEPAVLTLAAWNRQFFPGRMARLGARIEVLGERDWRAEEALAVRQIEAVPGFVVGGLFGLLFLGPLAAPVTALLAFAITLAVTSRGSVKQARERSQRLRQRLPAVIELMALMLEAGAGTLRECLEMAARENADHVIGEELRRVLIQIDQGANQADALREMGRRLDDPDVAQLVFALTTAEERGVPLRSSLRDMATQLRVRQVQWLEKAAEEARVHITWPGMVVTLACLLIVAAPIVFAFLRDGM
jgi:Flp pilus assembly protein TadB